MPNRNLTQRRLKERLRYNQLTGKFVWLTHRQNPALVGTVAGTTDPYTYVTIYVDGISYKAHRLAFLYVKGCWPIGRADHENFVKSDNRWSNLRDATASQNCVHVNRRKDNSSGFKGVDFFKSTGRWRARIAVGGKSRALGYYPTPKAAADAYDAAARELHGVFAVLNTP